MAISTKSISIDANLTPFKNTKKAKTKLLFTYNGTDTKKKLSVKFINERELKLRMDQVCIPDTQQVESGSPMSLSPRYSEISGSC